MKKDKKNDPRWPYTYAADYLREVAGYNEHGTKLSRADASKIRSTIAEHIGMADHELAEVLATAFQSSSNESEDLDIALRHWQPSYSST